jgi:hypothetical protein
MQIKLGRNIVFLQLNALKSLWITNKMPTFAPAFEKLLIIFN